MRPPPGGGTGSGPPATRTVPDSERFSMRRPHLGIRWKVLAVLALPVLVLALAAGTVTTDALHQTRTAHAVGAFAEAQGGVAQALTSLQVERRLSLASPRDVRALTAARRATDRDVTALASDLRTTRLAEEVPGSAALLGAIERGHHRLPEYRKHVDAGTSRTTVLGDYGALIDADVELAGAIGAVLEDRALGQRFAATTVIYRAVEATELAQIAGSEMITTARTTTDDAAAETPDDAKAPRRAPVVATPSAEQRAALAIAVDQQTRAMQQFRLGGSVVSPAVQQQATAAGESFGRSVAQLGLDGASMPEVTRWQQVCAEYTAAQRRLAGEVARDAATQAQSSSDSAQQRAAVVGGAAVALVGLMVLLALIQSRQITAPLRKLATATAHTREELPAVVDAIAVHGAEASLPDVPLAGHDEVSAVAASFRDVQETVLQAARAQRELRRSLAETFVNVARRNQVLLSRQLSMIDRLERTEENPDSLENLFRLDHLATRMRRNAESLLVLAGVDSGRRARGPMTLSDVVRSAISEIEHYDRVQLTTTVNPLVVAHLTQPAAHLLAELIENATQFSDPKVPVEITTSTGPDGVQVRITDHGLGMTPEELAEANARLGDIETSSLMPAHITGAQRIGHHVVARLAARIGASVVLGNAPDGGTVAVVNLPDVVFVAGATPTATGALVQIDVTGLDEPEPRPEPAVQELPAAEPEPWTAPEPQYPVAVDPVAVDPVAVDPVSVDPVQLPPALPLTRDESAGSTVEPDAALFASMMRELQLPDVAPSQAGGFEDLLTPSHWATSSGWADDEPGPENAGPPPLPPAPSAPLLPPVPSAPPAPPALPPMTPPSLPVAPAPAAYFPPELPQAPVLPRRAARQPDGSAPSEPRPPLVTSEPLTSWSGLGSEVFAIPEDLPAAPGPVAGPAHDAPIVPRPPLPSTMDVLPHHPARPGFSLTRLSRRGRPARPATPAAPTLLPAQPEIPAPRTPQDEAAAPGTGPSSWLPSSPPSTGTWGWTQTDAAEPSDPHAPGFGDGDDAVRAALASTALSELSMLAAYRPEVDARSAATLTRRSPAETPDAAPGPAAGVPPLPPAALAPPPRPRDADGVRSTLAGFLTGVSRGRRATEEMSEKSVEDKR